MIQGTSPSPEKIYPGSADEEYLKVFDMSVNDTTMYGSYSVNRPTVMEGVSATNEIIPDITVTPTTLQTIQADIDTSVNIQMSDYLSEGVDMLDGGNF